MWWFQSQREDILLGWMKTKTQQKPAPKLIHWDTKINSIALWSLQWVNHPLHTWIILWKRVVEFKPSTIWMDLKGWAFAPPHNFVEDPEEKEPGKKDKGKEGHKN